MAVACDLHEITDLPIEMIATHIGLGSAANLPLNFQAHLGGDADNLSCVLWHEPPLALSMASIIIMLLSMPYQAVRNRQLCGRHIYSRRCSGADVRLKGLSSILRP